MKQPAALNRRRFLQVFAGSSLSSWATCHSGWASISDTDRLPRFAYVGSAHAIHAYTFAAQKLIHRQTVASARPIAMAISGAHLYVANDVAEYGNLPRGRVEAYSIDRATGRLELKNIVPLSLSATSPRALAVSPDGRALVVAVHGGGAYNLLPIRTDGSLGPVSGILKETGAGPHPLQSAAHPAAVLFDRMGHVVAADQGSDRLSVLSLEQSGLRVVRRFEAAAGSGPTSLALHPNGERLYVAHVLPGSISEYGYHAGGTVHHHRTMDVRSAGVVAELAMHPSGELLFTTHGHDIQVWTISRDGRLNPMPAKRKIKASKLHATSDGNRLLALTEDAVVSFKVDAVGGQMTYPVKLVSLPAPLSIATV